MAYNGTRGMGLPVQSDIERAHASDSSVAFIAKSACYRSAVGPLNIIFGVTRYYSITVSI
jgi:hypothetical protein